MQREELVSALMAQFGLDRPTAEKRADRALARDADVSRRAALLDAKPGILVAPASSYRDAHESIDMIDEVPRIPTEAEVRVEVRTLYLEAGCDVWETSQFRAAKVRAGLPDAWVSPPPGHGPGWWHELKRPGGKRSEGQVLFKAQCDETGTPYVCGGVAAARAMLRQRGLLP